MSCLFDRQAGSDFPVIASVVYILTARHQTSLQHLSSQYRNTTRHDTTVHTSTLSTCQIHQSRQCKALSEDETWRSDDSRLHLKLALWTSKKVRLANGIDQWF